MEKYDKNEHERISTKMNMNIEIRVDLSEISPTMWNTHKKHQLLRENSISYSSSIAEYVLRKTLSMTGIHQRLRCFSLRSYHC